MTFQRANDAALAGLECKMLPVDSELPIECIISTKNTFIEIKRCCDDEQGSNPTRRSASLPPCHRFISSLGDNVRTFLDVKATGATNLCTASDASTVEDTPSESGSSTDADSGVGTPSEKTLVSLEDPYLDGSGLNAEEPGLGTSPRKSGLQLSDLIPEPVRPSLTSKAKAFVPGLLSVSQAVRPAMTSLPVLSHAFRSQVNAAVAALTLAMEALVGHIFEITTADGPGGWLIVASQRYASEKVIFGRERILSVAKESLLTFAEGSESLYVLGFAARPFVPITGGFKATVALMKGKDRSSSCWSLFSKGYCNSAGPCHRKHPTNVTDINVLVQLSGYM